VTRSGAGSRSAGALEIGGTHVSATRVDAADAAPRTDRIVRLPLVASAARDELLGALVSSARAVHRPDLRVWGVATPGPFDYASGVCLIEGVAKLDALYGVDLRHELARALELRSDALTFVNDADAFLLGEAWAGAAAGVRRAVGITLGTGLGSAFLADGRIVNDAPEVPPEGRLDLLQLDGLPVESSVSTRGLLRTYRLLASAETSPDPENAADLARQARSGDEHALRAFEHFGASLGRILSPWLDSFAPECLVVGGSIARAWDLFSTAFVEACRPVRESVRCLPARHPESAALLGAARVALGTER